MPLFGDAIDSSLSELIKQWNIAERRIKKAEQVRGNEVVASAIFELRYAGRKMIDSVEVALNSDLKTDAEKRKIVLRNIADATEDCVKAKHDAIDAMLDFIVTWLNTVEESIGLKDLQVYFPGYLATLEKIVVIQNKIAESRQYRNVSRDIIYDEIECNGYDDILHLYNTMRISKDVVQKEINRQRKISILRYIFDAIMAAIAIVSLLFMLRGH